MAMNMNSSERGGGASGGEDLLTDRLTAIERELAEYSLHDNPRWAAHAPGIGGVVIVGNPTALLRLATRLIHAARNPPPAHVDEPWHIPDSAQSADSPDEPQFCAMRWDDWQNARPVDASRTQPAWRDRLALFGCALVGFVLMFLMVSGVMFWARIL